MIATTAELAFALNDGRRLGYAEFGDPAGRPLFYQHGIPGSRLDVAIGAAEAAVCAVRLIALDRPGIGLSDFRPGYRLTDWPADVAEAADQLGLMRFAILGHSGGVPFSLACAALIPERLTRCGIVSGSAPMDRPGIMAGMGRANRASLYLARRAPWVFRLQTSLMARMVQGDPAGAMRQMQRMLRGPDRAFVTGHPEIAGDMAASTLESYRQGIDGVAWQTRLMLDPWGFRLADIDAEVHLWHGEEDGNAPIAMGRYLAQSIPHCQAHFLPGEGHLSALGNHLGEIFRDLTSDD